MTNALYATSLVVTGVLVVALAVALLTVLWILHQTSDTLGKVLFGVRAIAHRAAPVGDALTEVNTNLAAVRDALRDAVPAEPSDETGREASPAGTGG